MSRCPPAIGRQTVCAGGSSDRMTALAGGSSDRAIAFSLDR
jgi:hypothetical protein